MARRLTWLALLVGLIAQGCDRDRDTPHKAAGRGDLAGVQELLEEGDPVDGQDGGGFTALHESIRHRHPEISRYLIARGADVNVAAIYGVTPLHVVDDVEMAALLLAEGARVESWSKTRGTPLHSAVSRDLAELAALLIARDAPLEAEDVYGSTPLHHAAGRGNRDIARLLVESGANVDAVNSLGFTPLHWAAGNGHNEVVALLVGEGADIQVRSNEGTSPLDTALAKEHGDVARALEAAGAAR